ncbi:MAG: hypothetical protein KF773_39820 [Deltaproteobacteria bacterium]|nr:hypothetical protein [Deltaproteobacteria bacterium]
MTADLPTLLRRDHAEFHRELTLLLDPSATVADLQDGLDGLRLGLIAHAEAEDIVLGPIETSPRLVDAIREVRSSHLAQEKALATLVATRPGTDAWRVHAHYLREIVGFHARHEQAQLMPALRDHAPTFPSLAGLFATERLRQLGMLVPSQPILLPPELRADRDRFAQGSGQFERSEML